MYIGLRSAESGEYYLNGQWSIDASGYKQIAGTSFQYTRGANPTQTEETLTATGPTTEDIYLVVRDPDQLHLHSANTIRWINAGLMLAQHRRRWANIKLALIQRIVFVGHAHILLNNRLSGHFYTFFFILGCVDCNYMQHFVLLFMWRDLFWMSVLEKYTNKGSYICFPQQIIYVGGEYIL